MSPQDKVRSVMSTSLVSKGWQPVVNQDSGVFVKRGYVFVLYGNRLGKLAVPKEYGPERCVAAASVFYSLSGVSWHLEKHGWLLAKGQISSDIVALYDFPNDPVYRETTDTLVSKVDGIASADDEQSLSLRQRVAKFYKKVSMRHLKESDKPVGSTEFVKALAKLDGENGNLLEGFTYQLMDVLQNSIIFAEVKEDGSYAAESIVVVSKPDFFAACKGGYIKAMELQDGEGYEEYTQWVSAFNKDTVALPKRLAVLGITGLKKINLCSAFNENLNYTVLLNQEHSEEESADLLELLREGRDLTCMAGKHYGTEQLALIKKFVRNDYCLDYVAKPTENVKGLSIWADDFLAELNDEEVSLRSQGLPAESIKAVIQIKTFSYDYESPEMIKDAIAQHLLFLLSRGILSCACRDLLHFGIVYEPCLCMRWEDASLETRTEMRRMLALSCELQVCGQNWEDYLDRFFKAAQYLFFNVRRGFLIRYNNIILGKDSNSVVFYDVGLKPIWRAVLLNEEFIINRANEEKLKI